MKSVIHKNLSRDKMVHVLPRRFAERLPQAIEEPVTAVIFVEDVVTARIARKAAARLDRTIPGSLVLAARTFSVDALKVFEPFNRILLTTASDAVTWTDESYERIKVGIGARVKKPDL